MFEKLENCPLCNSGHFSNYLICKDYSVSKEEFAIVKCEECNFVFTNPRPHPDVLDKYYQSDDYISHQNKGNSIINILYQIARSFTLNKKVKLINKHSPKKGRLLDLGCGTGHFLSAAQKAGWEVTGVEPSALARKQAIDKNLEVVKELTNVSTDQHFDIITLWHVLEHLPDLNESISILYKLLNKKGTLIVAVPNYQSYDAQKFGKFWAGYDVPRHLYHFSHDTMKALMKKHKFKIKSILPMKLDAFYVSLLSNKYKYHGNSKFVNSFITGLKSNTYASKHDNNYSSNIFIISK